MMRNSMLRLGLLAGAAMLVLSACGGGSSSGSGQDQGAVTAPASGAAAFNDADVTFAQSMIPHHRQAVQMAALADGRASGAPVKELAAKIKAAQQPEIDTMNEWLTAWGRPTPDASMAMSGVDHGSMPGMMGDADMAKLAASTGPAFDQQFLRMMITHHEGAVTMAQQEAANGANPEAVALAKKIITDQQAEISAMKGLLGSL
jgi:uncharacterized protein (DUF305 family)